MPTPSKKWETLKSLFEAALEQNPAQRSSFLQEQCSDPSLRAEVERLLAEHEQAGGFLSTPAVGRITANPEASTEVLADREPLAGRFRVLRFIAAGGMGQVYEAEDLELREHVAIKTILPDILAQPAAVARFKREVHLARQVTHPNVCRIFDLFRHTPKSPTASGEVIFVSMELLKGQTLSSYLREVGSMKESDALPLIRQMASGLSAAHAAGIVHRDFKPGNVVLVASVEQKTLRPVITDFGLARQSLFSDESFSLSTSQHIVGTPAYMAPEQLEGRPATAASDIYAFGLVVYEMLTGAQPFQGDTPLSAALKRLSEDPTPPRKFQPGLSPAWEGVILRCLDRDAAKRPASAQDVIQALASEDRTVAATVDSRKQREVLYLANAVVVLLVLAAGAYEVYLRLHSDVRTSSFQNFVISRLTDTGNSGSAAISPDGNYVVNVVREHGTQSARLRNIATNSDTQIIPPADTWITSLNFSADGNYIYLRRGENPIFTELLREPVLGGTPDVVSKDTGTGTTFSPDGQHIAFMRCNCKTEANATNDKQEKKHTELVETNLDGSEVIILATFDDPFASFHFERPAWSPNGKRIVVTSHPVPDKSSEIIEVDVVTRKQRVLLPSIAAVLSDPQWLPNGRELAFVYRDTTGRLKPRQLVLLSYPQMHLRQITRDIDNYSALSLTHDGATIAAVQAEDTDRLFVVPANNRDGSEGAAISPADSSFSWAGEAAIVYGRSGRLLRSNDQGEDVRVLFDDPRFAPDDMTTCQGGRYVIFNSLDRNSPSGATNLWRVDSSNKELRQLTTGTWDTSPVCSPDGKSVYFVAQGQKEEDKVQRVSVDGGAPNSLLVGSDMADSFFGIDISRDQKFVALIVHSKSKTAIDIVDARNRKVINELTPDPRALVFSGAQIQYPHFTPDGKAVAYVVRTNGVENLWAQPLDGSPGYFLTSFKSDQISDFHWSPEGKKLGIVRGHAQSNVVLIHETNP